MKVMPLVGRAPEVAAVRAAVEAVSSGSGGLLLVTGEAGVGKSRLLTEAARVARDRGVWRRAAGPGRRTDSRSAADSCTRRRRRRNRSACCG